jgi:hypothetical protein
MRTLAVIASLLIAPSAFAQGGERLFGSNTDVRTTLAFKVPDSAAQKVLPAGWQVNSSTSGPTAGFNLAIVLIDQILAQDPDGKPTPPLRGAVLNVPARKTGSDAAGAMVFTGLVSVAGAPGAYGNYVPSRFVIDRKQHTEPDGKISVEESWEFKGEDGNALEVQINYVRAGGVRIKAENKVYSATKPDFYRIYRLEQIADVVRSTPAGTDRVAKFSFKASGPRLGPLFEGSQLIAATSLPWYARQTYLPGS